MPLERLHLLALRLLLHESCLLTHHGDPRLVLRLAHRYLFLLIMNFTNKGLISELLLVQSALPLDFIYRISMHTNLILPRPRNLLPLLIFLPFHI